MLYGLNPIPADALPYRRTEAARLRGKFVSDAYERDGVLFWKSNDRPVPPHCFPDAFCTAPAAQQAAHDKSQAAAIADYKRRQAERSPEQIAEERMMARAAMGPGAEMVNVLTGERYVT